MPEFGSYEVSLLYRTLQFVFSHKVSNKVKNPYGITSVRDEYSRGTTLIPMYSQNLSILQTGIHGLSFLRNVQSTSVPTKNMHYQSVNKNTSGIICHFPANNTLY